ncbi:MAG: hypothetical protein L6R45_10390 [Anaerolineae bacterium]|nr:hypothetical protein [Anaerolineae bacterium]
MARTVAALPVGGKYPKPLIHCTGRPETGKTQLAISFALWLNEMMGKHKVYVWPTDGREHEYAQVLGTQNTLAPNANPLDVTAVHDEIAADLRKGEFKDVSLFSVDTVTHIYREASTTNQLKGMTGQGSSGHSLKAVTMMNVVTIVMAVNLPAMVITHVYEKSDHENLKNKSERDSISETEEARWKLAFNMKLETGKDDKGYFVVIRECRERPGMQPRLLRDKEGGMFRTMPERIMRYLYDVQPPADEPKGWKDFGAEKPFPGKGDDFKQNAVREMMNYFVEVEPGVKIYPFGDPAAQPTKKNGDPGINGAANHALNAYAKVAQEFKEAGGKGLGQLTVKLKEYVEAKVETQVQAYLNKKVEPEAPAQVEQTGLGLEVPATEPAAGSGYGGGAL